MLGSLNICSIPGGDGQVRPYEGPEGTFQEGLDRSTLSKEANQMKLRTMLAMGFAVLAMAAVPATGVADGPDYQPPEGPNYEHPNHPPQGPKTAPKGKAYGYYCRGQSKKHVKGEKGTAFSRCVKAMAQADKNDNLNAKKACKSLKTVQNRHKPHGEKGTAFSRCVKAVNQMRREEAVTVSASSVA
jgi:hypothetical protein